MSRGISLHIGLNRVDATAYNGWDGVLSGCINDANSMRSIAVSQGFAPTTLLDGQATSSNVLAQIGRIAGELVAGDMFVLTYSGHGGQVPDSTGEETDGLDETWVLFDRQLIDNELYRLWSKFRAGVRIFVTSDSCHSGTVVRQMLRQQAIDGRKELLVADQAESLIASQYLTNSQSTFLRNGKSSGSYERTDTLVLADIEPSKLRFMPFAVSVADYERRKDQYCQLAMLAGAKDDSQIQASLLYISGCQDNQLSYDGAQNGQFTGKLMQAWNQGGFSGNYQAFYNQILASMPSNQTPAYLKLGTTWTEYERQKPFTMTAPAGGTGSSTGTPTNDANPRVQGPASCDRTGIAPVFTINKGANPYYYLEITSDPKLFDYQTFGSQRTSQNFYATWNDPQQGSRLTNAQYQLPSYAWASLKSSQSVSRLYYRIGTTTDPATWANFMVTTADDQGQSAPSIQITDSGSTGGGLGGTTTDTSISQSITASVGSGGSNRTADVLTVQKLLNLVRSSNGGPTTSLIQDGLIGSNTIRAIQRFQEVNELLTNSLVTPTGTTLLLLRLRSGLITLS